MPFKSKSQQIFFQQLQALSGIVPAHLLGKEKSVDKLKKGQVVNVKEVIVSKELKNVSARIINTHTNAYDGEKSIRIRFQSPIQIKMGKKKLAGVYTASVSENDVEFDAIKTLKSVMRSSDKKNTKRSVKKTKAGKRTSKGRGNTSTKGNSV